MQAEALTATVPELVTTLKLNERDVTAVLRKRRRADSDTRIEIEAQETNLRGRLAMSYR